ncbi:MAG: CPBP family intramembrane glutamic endopeptidase [Chloroflexota bacterium]
MSQSGDPSLRIRRRKAALNFLTGGVALVLLAVLTLRLLENQTNLPGETLLALLSLLTLLVLGFAVGGLGYVLRSSLSNRYLSPILLIVFLAYLLPAGVYLALGSVLANRLPILNQALHQGMGLSSLFPAQPWLFLWQALILAFVGAPPALPRAAEDSAHRLPGVPLGLLGGAAIGLAAAFAFSLGSAWLESSRVIPLPVRPADVPPLLQAVIVLVGIGIAPWAEERFFRAELLVRWQPRLGAWGAAAASAALFATLQFRPLLWLPAFVAGLGLALLAQSAGSLRPAILAHAVANALLFALGWYLLI